MGAIKVLYIIIIIIKDHVAAISGGGLLLEPADRVEDFLCDDTGRGAVGFLEGTD